MPAEKTISVTNLQPPNVILPLDITRLVPDFTQGVPPSLTRFHALSNQLSHHLSLLPLKDAYIPADWLEASKEWSQAVIRVLKEMYKITQELESKKPAELKGSYHAIEEYRGDIATTLQEFERLVRDLRGVGNEDMASARKTVEGIRGIYMLRAYF